MSHLIPSPFCIPPSTSLFTHPHVCCGWPSLVQSHNMSPYSTQPQLPVPLPSRSPCCCWFPLSPSPPTHIPSLSPLQFILYFDTQCLALK